MITLLVLVGATTLVQLILCGIHFPLLLCIAGRAMFAGKMLGMKIKLKITVLLEGVALAWYLLIPFLFKSPYDVVSLIAQIVCSIICILIEWIDETFFSYYTEVITDKKEHK